MGIKAELKLNKIINLRKKIISSLNKIIAKPKSFINYLTYILEFNNK